jgi:hypothetical protein
MLLQPPDLRPVRRAWGPRRACIHPIRAEESSEAESSAQAPGTGSRDGVATQDVSPASKLRTFLLCRDKFLVCGPGGDKIHPYSPYSSPRSQQRSPSRAREINLGSHRGTGQTPHSRRPPGVPLPSPHAGACLAAVDGLDENQQDHGAGASRGAGTDPGEPSADEPPANAHLAGLPNGRAVAGPQAPVVLGRRRLLTLPRFAHRRSPTGDEACSPAVPFSTAFS